MLIEFPSGYKIIYKIKSFLLKTIKLRRNKFEDNFEDLYITWNAQVLVPRNDFIHLINYLINQIKALIAT